MLVVFDTASRCPVVPASEPAWHGVTVISMATTNDINPFRLWLHKCDTFSILDSSQITLVNVIFLFAVCYRVHNHSGIVFGPILASRASIFI